MSNHDSSSNFTEYLAGTDPTDAKSLFHITSIEAEDESLVLSWTSVDGKTYKLQRSGDLATDSWVDLETGIEATEPTNSYTHEMVETKAFYRVVVE